MKESLKCLSQMCVLSCGGESSPAGAMLWWEGSGGCGVGVCAGCQQLILMDANDLAQPGTKTDQTDCLKRFSSKLR